MPVRNREREQYIYNARKFDKRTYADIGRDLGITRNRIRQIYVRIDWELKKKAPPAHAQRKLKESANSLRSFRKTRSIQKSRFSTQWAETTF